MSIFSYFRKLFRGQDNLIPASVTLNKFPINSNISKISYTKEKSSLKESEWTVKEKNIRPNILMSCVNELLQILKTPEQRKILLPHITDNYKSSEIILENLINTIDNDFFIDKEHFESIVKGKYVLNNTYSDLSIFYFNVLVYGHPLLYVYSNHMKTKNDILSRYSEYIVEFDYDGTQHSDTMKNHVIICLYFVLKVIFVD